MDKKRKIHIRAVRREPVDLDRLAIALLALARQLADEKHPFSPKDTRNDPDDVTDEAQS